MYLPGKSSSKQSCACLDRSADSLRKLLLIILQSHRYVGIVCCAMMHSIFRSWNWLVQCCTHALLKFRVMQKRESYQWSWLRLYCGCGLWTSNCWRLHQFQCWLIDAIKLATTNHWETGRQIHVACVCTCEDQVQELQQPWIRSLSLMDSFNLTMNSAKLI